MGSTPAPMDLSIENLASLASQCAADLGCDVVVGFSTGASIALEMAASGEFRGPLVLLAPSFSRQDEAVFFRLLERLARGLGHLPFSALLKMMGPAMKHMPLPADRREVLAAEFPQNDPRVIRAEFTIISVPGPPWIGRVPAGPGGRAAWVVHGERGDGGSPTRSGARWRHFPDTRDHAAGASYLTPNEEPALVARLVIDALDRVRGGQQEQRSEHLNG